jgi:hypothetical protein
MAVLTIAYAALGAVSLTHVMEGLARAGHTVRELPSCEVVCVGELDGVDAVVLPLWGGEHSVIRMMRHIRSGDAGAAKNVVLVVTGQEDPEVEVFRDLRGVRGHFIGVYEHTDVWHEKLSRLRTI